MTQEKQCTPAVPALVDRDRCTPPSLWRAPLCGVGWLLEVLPAFPQHAHHHCVRCDQPLVHFRSVQRSWLRCRPAARFPKVFCNVGPRPPCCCFVRLLSRRERFLRCRHHFLHLLRRKKQQIRKIKIRKIEIRKNQNPPKQIIF